MSIPDELSRLARAQDGLVTRQQALARGMSAEALRHLLGAGRRWQRVARGVYATFTGPLSPRHRIRAALLHAGPSAVVTGGYACRSYGMRYVPADSPLVLLVPAASSKTPTAFALLRRVSTMPTRRWRDDIPVTAPERAVLDTCHEIASLRTVRALLCESVQRGLATSEHLSTELGDACWKGSGLVRLALDDTRAGCRSAPECELRDLVRSSAVLPEPAWNQPLAGTPDGVIPDACWPDARVVVEIDSAEWHRLGDLVERTERRRTRYAALGWTVLSISPRRLREDGKAVLTEIESAVLAGYRRNTTAV